MTEKDDLCLKKVYPVRRSECIRMKKQRLRRLPIAFTAKRDARRGKHMNTGFARSKRCVEKLRPPIPKVHQRKVRPRLHGPRILRSKSKFPENSLRPSAQRGARCRSGSCLQTAGSERVENAIFSAAVCVGREIRWRFVSLGGHAAARSAFLSFRNVSANGGRPVCSST